MKDVGSWGGWLVMGLLAGAGAACTPDTRLGDESAGRLTGDGGPGDPATAAGAPASAGKTPFRMIFPAAGTQGVPRNLSAVRLAAPASMAGEGEPSGWRLRASSGVEIPLGEFAPEACPGRLGCYVLPVRGPLNPGASYALEWRTPAPVSASRQAASFAPVGTLTAGTSFDETQPELLDGKVDAGAGCVRVQLRADEPVIASIRFHNAAMEETVAAGAGLAFDLAVRLSGLAPGPAGAVIGLVDAAGNRFTSADLGLNVPAAVPPLAITEILANPAGSETTQEFVEVQNFGSEAISLAGWSIEDGGGADQLGAVSLGPGAIALVTGAAFDAHDGQDPSPRAGTLLIRVTGRLGRDGLGNDGESVRLRAPDGTLVSSYGGWVNTSAAAWNGKSVHRTPGPGGCDHPSGWTQAPSAPTPGW